MSFPPRFKERGEFLKSKLRPGRTGIHLLFLLCFLFLQATARAQQVSPDTLQKANVKWNGIWDPNDPLCPCYEAQKQAEKEYKKLLKEEQKEEANNAESQTAGRAKNSSSRGLFYATGKKMKKFFSRKKKKKKILDDCFNFS